MEGAVYRQRAYKYIEATCTDTAKSVAWSLGLPNFDEFNTLSLLRVIQELDIDSHINDVQRVRPSLDSYPSPLISASDL